MNFNASRCSTSEPVRPETTRARSQPCGVTLSPTRLAWLAATTIAWCTAACESRAQPPGPIIEAATGHSWTLLIGIDDYTDLDDNRFCCQDVAQIQSRFIAAGWPVANVFLMSDQARSKYVPSKENIQRQVELFSELPTEGDLAVILFRGRMVHLNGQTYLCPTEAQLGKAEATLISIADLYRTFASCQAATRLLVLDPVGPVDAAWLEGLSEPPEGVAVWMACRPGETSAEHAGIEGSAFMRALAHGLEGAADADGNGDLMLSELVGYVKAECPRLTQGAGAGSQNPGFVGKLSGDVRIGHTPQHAPSAALYPTLQQDAAETSARLEAVVGINPRSLRAFNQAVSSYAMGDFRETIEYCNAAAAMDPENRWAKVLRALAHCQRKDFAKAIEDYAELGIPLPCRAAVETNLMAGAKATTTVRPSDVLYVTNVKDDWLWVSSVAGDNTAQGWIKQANVY